MKIKSFAWENLAKPILALAPMAGVTDSSFRRLCREFGADVVYGEMVSATGLFHKSSKTKFLLEFNQEEQPFVVQLFGSNPEHFAYAARYITEEIKPAGIDINFGCPVRKVLKAGAGSSLMKNLNLADEVIQAVLANTTLPVSIKTRTFVENVSVLELLQKIQKLPIAAIMIHGRSSSQKFSGPINKEIIGEAKNIFPGVVLANGNMHTPEEISAVLKETKVDGVGLARGVLGRPYLFRQAKDYFSTGAYKRPAFADIKKIILAHAAMIEKQKGEWGIREMRKHLGWYVQGFPGAKVLRSKLYAANSYRQVEEILNLMLENKQ